MWELDRLIRSPKVGNGTLDATALVRLRTAHRLQVALGIGTEQLLTMLGDLGTTARHVPSDPSKTTPSPYDALFQNRLVTNPVDPAFALPLAAGGHLEDHRPALAAAVAVTDADLQLLLARTNGDLTVANLARLAGLATLARGLRLRVRRPARRWSTSPPSPTRSPRSTRSTQPSTRLPRSTPASCRSASWPTSSPTARTRRTGCATTSSSKASRRSARACAATRRPPRRARRSPRCRARSDSPTSSRPRWPARSPSTAARC